MMNREEIFEEALDSVTGGYIGFNYDETTGVGKCGLGTNRNYDIVDYSKFQAILRSTEGQGDVARMKALISGGAIKK